MGYTAFWHVTLYGFGWSSRPLVKDRKYSAEKVMHNIFWSISGIAIWTVFDNVFAFLWASNRLSYMNDLTSFSSYRGLFLFAVVLAAIPLWRDIHFYFAHRLLHFRPLFVQCHSLHHRNTDIEPFAGLCMHPVEHLYYYSCILPSLIFSISPFAFVWNGVHLLLAPGASHSGFEDHFQADSYHYAHHRWFECNYAGTSAGVLDVWFGSYVGSFSDKEKIEDGGCKMRQDAKSTLNQIPSSQFMLYLGLSALCLIVAIRASSRELSLLLGPHGPIILGIIAGLGPVILSILITVAFSSDSTGTDVFGKNPLANIFQLLVGTAFCALPITYAIYLVLL